MSGNIYCADNIVTMIVMISHLLTGPGNSRWVYSEGVWDSCQDCYGEGQVKLSQSFRILQVLGTKVLFMKWMFCLTYFKDLILVYSAFFVYDVLASQVSSWRAECKSKKSSQTCVQKLFEWINVNFLQSLAICLHCSKPKWIVHCHLID